MHRYMYMVNRGSGPPPPPPDLWEVVSRGGLDRDRVAVITFLYSVLFQARFAHLLWISLLFFTLFTINFKLKGSFNLTFPFRVITNIAGFYGKTLFTFILLIVARISTKIKHFLGEDGYILYQIDWKSANIILKNIPWDDPLELTPSPTDIFYSIKTHSLCLLLPLPKKACIYTPDVHELLTLHLKDNSTISCTKCV